MNFAGPLPAAEFRITPALRFGLRSTWDNAGLALRMYWPWLAILTGLDLAAGLAPGFPLTLLLQPVPEHGYSGLLLGLIIALKLLAVSSLSVIWTRFLLLGEIATGWDRLRVDRAVWRFACNGLVIWLACSGLFLLGSLISFVALPLIAQFSGYSLPEFPRALPAPSGWLQNAWMLIIGVSMSIGVLSGLPVVQRLSIKLVAIALGRDDYGLGDAWRDSGGQPLPLVTFTFVVTALVTLTWAGAFFIAYQLGEATAAGLMASAAAVAVASGLTIILATASIAVLFGMCVEGRAI